MNMKKILHSFLYYPGSIQAKIFIAFSLVVLLSISAVSVMIYLNFSKTIRQNAVTYIHNVIVNANENFEMIFGDIERISTVVIIDERHVLDPLTNDIDPVSFAGFRESRATEDFLTSLMAYKTYISRVSVIGLNGKIFHTGGSMLFQSVLEETWFQKALTAENKQILLNAPEKGGVSLSRIIRKNNRPIGVAVIDFDKTFIDGLFKIEPVEGSMLFVADPLGNFIVHPDVSEESASAMEALLPLLHAEEEAPPVRMLDVPEHRQYLVVRHHSPVTDWITYGLVPYDKLMSEAAATRNQVVAVSALIYFVVLIVSVMLSGQITKNLRQLFASMSKVSQGLLTARPVIQSKDEIGILNEKFNSMMNTIDTLIEEMKVQERMKLEAELSALQSQIKPHFIYNTLGTIKNLASIQNVKNIEQLIQSFIELLRMSLGNTRETIAIREEVQYLKHYVNIQQYKYLDKIDVNYQIEEDVLDCLTIKLLLQPIVENAMHHAIDEHGGTLKIIVRIYRESNGIKIEVIDNGVGMTAEKIHEVMSGADASARSRGMGIRNVNDRIRLTYGAGYGLSIYSEPGMYTTVEMTIPEIREEAATC